MIRDTEGQPGALPLLSHALVETWRRREHGLLTVEGYVDSGGLRGAVAASADRLYESLSDVERVQLRRLMLRMVSLSDAGEPVRSQPAGVRRVAEDPARHRVLDRLARARLVTTDQRTRSSWRTRPSPGRGRGCGPGSTRAWRSSSWCATSPRRPRAGTRSAARQRALPRRPAAGRHRVAGPRRRRPHAAGARVPRRRRRPAPTTPGLATERQIRHERRQNRRLRVLLAGVVALLARGGRGRRGRRRPRPRGGPCDRDLRRGGVRAERIHEALVGRSLHAPGDQPLRGRPARRAGLPRAPGRPVSQSALLGSFIDARPGSSVPAPRCRTRHPRRRDPRYHSAP